MGMERELRVAEPGQSVCFFIFLAQNAHEIEAISYSRWRQHADPLCDEALGILFPGTSSSTGIDLFTALKQHTESTRSEDAAWLFYDTFSQIPPPDLCVTEEEYKVAVAFFLDHAVQISQALSYYSLAGGFARCNLLSSASPASSLC